MTNDKIQMTKHMNLRSLLVYLAVCAVFFVCLNCERAYGAEREKKVKWVKSKYGLKALIELSKTRGKMVKDLKDESKNYDKVKTAIESDSLKKGETVHDVRRRYGDPVIILSEDEVSGATRWVYKPYQSTYFKGEKAYLFFDGEGALTEWRLLDQEGKSPFSGLLGG